VDVSWNGRLEAWNSRGCRPHLPWNGHSGAWNWRGTQAECQDRRAVELPWNGHSRGVELSWNSGGALPWNCRGTAVEVALRAAKLPGAKSRAPDPLFLWRVVRIRGTHLSPFPVRRAVLLSGHIHAPGPPVAPDHEGMPRLVGGRPERRHACERSPIVISTTPWALALLWPWNDSPGQCPRGATLDERIPTPSPALSSLLLPLLSPCVGASRVCTPVLHARGGRH